MEVHVDTSEIVALARQLAGGADVVEGEVMAAGREAGFLIQREATLEAPVVQGVLLNMIGPPETTGGDGEVITTVTSHAPYSIWVHDGRGPVEAKNAKALRFVVGGQVLYRKRVGSAKANPYMKRGLANATPAIYERFAEALIRAMARVLGGG
jgi:hypothetical protein